MHQRFASRGFRLVPAGVLLTVLAGFSGAAFPSDPGLPEPKPLILPEPFSPGRLPHGPRYTPLSNWPPAEISPDIDILHYDLDLRFELNGFEVEGTATLTLVWENDPDNVLTLDLAGPTVTGVSVPSGPAPGYQQNAATLEVTFPPGQAPVQGDTVVVAIDYQVVNSPAYTIGAGGSHTFAEPNGAPAWFPCHDVPGDKATLTLSGTCATGKTVVSNGSLLGAEDNGGTTTFHWEMNQPVATYLIAVGVSNYAAVTPPSTVTPLTWYVFPGHEAAALAAFARVDTMLAFYDSTLVPWPYPKYAQIEGNFGGGMEHTTCTLMATFIVTAGQTYEWVTAHELAHQYFGDWVTLESWQHVWLNEGFATFYDMVWHEAHYGAAVFRSRMDSDEAAVLNYESQDPANQHAIVDPPTNKLFSTLEYNKASWVLRMLRDLMGKSSFDAGITEYLTTYGGGTASTADLQAILETHHGESLDWFFTQWLYGVGSPRVAYHPVVTNFGGTWQFQLDLTQIQGTPTVYRLPIEIRVTTGSGDTLVTEWMESDHEVLLFELPEEPLSFLVDPDNRILGTFEEAVASGVDGTPPVRRLRAWPNPFSRRLNVAPPGGDAGPVTLDVFDIAGRRVRSLGTLEPGTGSTGWDGTDARGQGVLPGVYFIRNRETGDAIRVVRIP